MPSPIPASSTVGPAAAPGRVQTSLPRLHAWLGVIPLSLYLVFHLAAQSAALGGFGRYVQMTRWLEDWPLSSVLPWVVVLLPLALHAALGVLSVLRIGGAGGTWPRRGRQVLQQASGVAVLVFVLVHVHQFRARTELDLLDRGDYFSELCASLSATVFGGVPLMAAFYLAGVGAAALHCSNGLHHAGQAWASRSALARRWLGPACVTLGLTMFLVGAALVIDLATGSAWIRLSAAPRDLDLQSSAPLWGGPWHTVTCSA